MVWSPYIALTLLLPLLFLLGWIIRKQKKYGKSRLQFQYFSHQESFDYALFDVRDRKAYEKGHVPQAVHFPLNEVNYLPLEDMFINIFIYGARRADSRQACDYLSKNGYFNVYDLGPFKFWKEKREKGKGTDIESFSEEIKKIRKKQEQA